MKSNADHDPISADNLKRRIEVVYMAATGKPDPWGSKAWFGRMTGHTPRAVNAWCSPIDARGPRTTMVYAELRRLERKFGAALIVARKRWDLLHGDTGIVAPRSRSGLSAVDVMAVRMLGGLDVPLSNIAAAFRISKSSVCRLISRQRRSEVPNPRSEAEREEVERLAGHRLGSTVVHEPRDAKV